MIVNQVSPGTKWSTDDIEDLFNVNFGWTPQHITLCKGENDEFFILLFSNENGGYQDTFYEDRIEFMGSGPNGDQDPESRRNQRLIESIELDFPVYLFHKGKGEKRWTSFGEVNVVSYRIGRKNGRKVVLFDIRPMEINEGASVTDEIPAPERVVPRLSPENEHRRLAEKDVQETLNELECQPILFVGTGISKRYFEAPSWHELLEEMSAQCPIIDKPYGYYKQDMHPREIGQLFSEKFKEWAWEVRSEEFPEELFEGHDSDIYLKYKISEYVDSITPESLESIAPKWEKEIELLVDIEPHAIITTNYDRFLELVFPDYKPIIGQEIYGTNYASIGEIFKIHGCVSRPGELVLTKADYDKFEENQKYLSAKLLTYFAEHPVMIVGYGAEDPNIRRILSDIDVILTSGDNLIPNIHFVEWSPDITDADVPARHKSIPVGGERSVRVNSAHAFGYEWIYEAFGRGGNIEGVNIKLLRTLLANTYDIVTTEAPRKKINYESLQLASDEDRLATLFGIAPLDDQSALVEEIMEHYIGVSDSQISVSIEEEGGVPVNIALSTEPATSPNDRLRTAARDWRSIDDLISNRIPIYEFYRDRASLDHTDRTAEFLFRSSISNYIPGTEWLINYSGDVNSLFREIIQDRPGHESILTLERIFCVLGEKELLSIIAQDPALQYGNSKVNDFIELSKRPLLHRVESQFPTTGIIQLDQKYPFSDLLDGSIDVDKLLDDIISQLLENDDTQIRTSLRQLELVRLKEMS